jgi:2-iminobutanoate/2-iminopropanoate deaminase
MVKKVELHSEESFTFSSYVVAGDFIYTSHIGGFVDKQGNVLETVEEQTRQTLENLKDHLAREGATLNDVVKTTVYLEDLAQFDRMVDVYREYFTEGYPARMTATTEFIEPECLIQLDVVTYIGED